MQALTSIPRSVLAQGVKVEYVPVSVVLLDDASAPGGRAVYLKEPWIEGRGWNKWTRNDGHVFAGAAL